MKSKKIRAAVFGCGRMGLHHVKAIGVCEGTELVGVVDPYVDVQTIQAALPAGVKIYRNGEALLQEQRPDVVHVVTPPDTHVGMARLALEYGAHVYIEKPFALSTAAAREIIDLAQARSLKVCAGHQVLFQHSGQHYRRYLAIIGRTVHIESYFSFKIVRRVGGGLMSPAEQLVDILPHPIYTMLDAYDAASPESVGQPCDLVALDTDAHGEVRALFKRGGVPAMLTVTLRGRPIESYLRMTGVNGSLWIDFVLSGITRLLGPGTSAISAVLNPFIRARQMVFGTIANVYRMLTRKHKGYAGLAKLVEAFHSAVATGAASPVSSDAIIETVRLCELIGARLNEDVTAAEKVASTQLDRQEEQLQPADGGKGAVLVTGGTGFLGKVVVAELRNQGWPVRVVARRLPSVDARVPGATYVLGDIASPLSDTVFDGVSVIVHLAAETRGDKADHERNTILATRNLLEAAAHHGIRRFLHTGSIAVLRPSGRWGGPLTEDSAVDSDNLGRGPYVWAKAKAEQMVSEFCQQRGIIHRQIRLGPLVDFADFTPPGRLGREVGPLFIATGLPGGMLSVCDVRTAATVIRYYLDAFDSVPSMLNLIEAKQPTRGELVDRLRAVRPDLKVLWLPMSVVWLLSTSLKLALRVRNPTKKPLDLYAAFVSERYDNALARRVIQAAGGSSAEGCRAAA